MTEILTESFCERCGTRYTFESAAPRKSRLSRVRTMSRGLRNYVLEDESSFSEAMADARSEDERSATAHQLDAFHKTFNFCMTCRQYTCSNCWNTEDGRCLTCAPVPGTEVEMPAADAVPDAAAALAPLDAAWPDADLGSDRLARALGVAAADAAVTTPERSDQPELEPAAATGVPADLAGASDQVPPAETPPVVGLAPGQRLEDAVAAYEAEVAAQEAAARDADTAAAAGEAAVVELEQEIETAPHPDLPMPGPETAAVAPEAPAPEPPAAPGLPPAPAREDVVTQPTWPVAASATPAAPAPTALPAPPAPDVPAAPANPWLTVAPDDGTAAPEPQWPIASQWGRNARTDVPTTLAGRQLLPREDAASLWAASAAEVLSGGPGGPQQLAAPAPAAPQPCVSCGLSLSANARFCRRCGSRQG